MCHLAILILRALTPVQVAVKALRFKFSVNSQRSGHDKTSKVTGPPFGLERT